MGHAFFVNGFYKNIHKLTDEQIDYYEYLLYLERLSRRIK